METIIEKTYREARKLHSCPLFTGKESFAELMRLFLNSQGIEFCQKNQFPDMELMREFKGYGVDKYGIHIDAGMISLKNEDKICIVGNTEAELSYDDPSKRHTVVLMHGAKARIIASGYAVVFVYASNGCSVSKTVQGFAKIL